MTVSFPARWRALQYPHIRAELISHLQDASASDLWRKTSEVEFLVHFIFDDHDFKPASEAIGFVLLDHAEADALTEFVDALDRAIGPPSKGLKRLTHSDWAAVPPAAARALETLLRAGTPRYE